MLHDAPDLVRGRSALAADLARLPATRRARAIGTLRRSGVPVEDLPYLRADSTGAILYVDPARPPDRAQPFDRRRLPLADVRPSATVIPIDRDDVFRLHSKPGAPRTVYVNFRGKVVTGTAWNGHSGVASHTMLPYSQDGDTDTVNQAEADTIAEVWKGIAEDFAPFDIDVTTEAPPAFGPNVGEILVSPRLDQAGNAIFGPAGGVAYVGVWGRGDFPYYSPALVFPEALGSAKNIIEAASHELGHNLGLSHDGRTGIDEYYGGHGTGLVSWGPLMGVGYYANVTQWSRGDYSNANNTQDDLAVIAGKLGWRADDHGATAATATPLGISGGVVASETLVTDPLSEGSSANRGIIGSASDEDVFTFELGGDGAIDVTITPEWTDAFKAQGLRGSNLDVEAVLHRADGSGGLGTEVASSNPPTDTAARIEASLTAGRYHLLVRGVGVGTASTGYTDYGSLGHYFIAGTLSGSIDTDRLLAVSTTGTGRGSVGSDPAGISCGTDCTGAYAAGSTVDLTASAAAGSVFAGWSGACSGSHPACSLVMAADRSVTARFTAIRRTLTVSMAGLGRGRVTSAPAGIACGADCTMDVAPDTLVTLSARARAGSAFGYWSGGCTGRTPTCVVRMSQARTATAVFNRLEGVRVSVDRQGAPGGRVVSKPLGLNCGPVCSVRVPKGATVVLSAPPTDTARLAGWSGPCALAGAGAQQTCTVKATAAARVTARFRAR
jgi:hypothetical protein